MVRVVGVHLCGFDNAPDDLVFDGDLNRLPVLGNLHREALLAQYESCGRRDLANQPVTYRYIVEFEISDFIALGNHEGGFFDEFGFVGRNRPITAPPSSKPS